MSPPTTTRVAAGNRYCFTVSAVDVNARSACSSYDLRKIEFDISSNCRTTAKDLTYDGQVLATSYQAFPSPINGLVFKITRPNSLANPLSTEAGIKNKPVEVCFTLPSGPCSTLDTFCRGGDCTTAFFSPNNKCCALEQA